MLHSVKSIIITALLAFSVASKADAAAPQLLLETAKCTYSSQDLKNGFIQLEKECLKLGPCANFINNKFWKPKGSNCGGLAGWVSVSGVLNVSCGGITYEQCA